MKQKIAKKDILYCKSRSEWRKWLQANFDQREDIWFVYPKVGSNKPSVSYNDAVEEALCFGWIDSLRRSLDEDHSIQRFSIRKSKLRFSQSNKERIRWLWKKDLIHPSIKKDVAWILEESFVFPEVILEQLQMEPEVWKNFERMPEGYKRLRIAYIDDARSNKEEFEKRIQNFIKYTRGNRLIRGYGGIEKYY